MNCCLYLFDRTYNLSQQALNEDREKLKQMRQAKEVSNKKGSLIFLSNSSVPILMTKQKFPTELTLHISQFE